MNLRRNTLYSLMGSLAPALAALALVPATLARLGNDAFGVLTLLLALIGYFSIFDFGMGRSLTFRLALLTTSADTAEPATQDARRAQTAAVLTTGLLITLATGAFGALVIHLLAPLAVGLGFKVPQQHQADALGSLQWVALGIVFVTMNSATRGALEGLNQFKIANLNKALAGVGTFLVPYLVTQRGSATPLTDTATLLVALRLGICLLELGQVLRITKTRWAHFRPTWLHAKDLLSYGGWLLVSNVLSPLMVYGDRFVIGAIVGTFGLPFYAIPQEGLQRFLLFPSALCSALMPRLSGATHGDFSRIMRRSERMNNWGMLALCAVLAVALHPFLTIWISAEFANQALVPSLIMVVGLFFNANAMIKYIALHALGKTKETAVLHAIEFVIFFAALVVLTQQFGIVGAAAAWTGRVVIDNLLLRWLLKQHHPQPDSGPR